MVGMNFGIWGSAVRSFEDIALRLGGVELLTNGLGGAFPLSRRIPCDSADG
jgi:hypothetical protein